MSKIPSITDSELQAVLQDGSNQGKMIIIDFWADWCGPCKVMAPIFDEYADAHPDVLCYKVDVDENKENSTKYGVRSIPTLLVGKIATNSGNDEHLQVIDKIIGAVTSLDQLEAKIDALFQG